MSTPTPTPTPRTYAAKIKSGFAAVPDQFYEFARTLETELTALTAARDQLRADCDNEPKWAAHYLAQSIADKARAELAEADAAAYLKRAESFCKIGDEAEAELAAERARLDWVFRNCKVTSDDFTVHDREDLGVAMKEDAK